jgi:hypothetical protein
MAATRNDPRNGRYISLFQADLPATSQAQRVAVARHRCDGEGGPDGGPGSPHPRIGITPLPALHCQQPSKRLKQEPFNAQRFISGGTDNE